MKFSDLGMPSSADNFSNALYQEFAQLMGRLHQQLGGEPSASAQVQRAAAALLQAQQHGHACLPASQVPTLNLSLLKTSPVFSAPGAPLVLSADGNLYLRRYFNAEQQLETKLRTLDCVDLLTDEVTLQAALEKVFSTGPDAEATSPAADAAALNLLPRQAVWVALTRRLCVLCGGPGTGKTYTLARLVQALRLVQPQLRIALAAPTGKAAARLQSALSAIAKNSESPSTESTSSFFDDASFKVSTVHRLLGIGSKRADSAAYYHANKLLPADVVIVDEASMLSLNLAEKLFAALAPNARVVLVGDPNQLAAVETGSVLTPLANSTSPAVVRLQHAWRFAPNSNVPTLAQAVLNQDAVPLIAQTHNALPSAAQLFAGYEAWWQAVQRNASPQELLACFDDYRVLAALRQGPRGVAGLNAALSDYCRARLLNASGYVASAATRAGKNISNKLISTNGEWFAGRPILITRNDSATQLVNGDIGITLPDAASGWRVVFLSDQNDVRSVVYTELPPHETAFALTVHKAQGSEYREVALVLPEQPSRVLTRELLYTGITRAKNQVHLFASEAVLQAAVATPSLRWSGLSHSLAQIG